MGQVDPTKSWTMWATTGPDSSPSYADSQGATRTNTRKSKTVWGRWHPVANRARLQALVDRMLLNRSFRSRSASSLKWTAG